MKRFYKLFATWFLCLFLVLSQFIVSLADVKSLMIGTGSNALLTMEIDDSDYAVMPMSSITVIQNTVEWTSKPVLVAYYSGAVGDFTAYRPEAVDTGDGVQFAIDIRDFHGFSSADYLSYIDFNIENIPRPGKYLMTLDLSNNFSTRFTGIEIRSQKDFVSASPIVGSSDLDFEQSSGDLYVAPVAIEITSLSDLTVRVFIDHGPHYSVIDALFKASFVPYDGDVSISTVGSATSSSDFDYEISDSLSDLSSSVDTMTDEISGVTEAIQNLQGAMEPHYSNVLTQLHHITEQLHAFYDQVYNNIHLPELSMLTLIKEAIENIDLQIEVDISEVKTAINNMSTAVQNKLQSTTDQITNGYDNSGIVQENEKLEQSINDYDEVESEIFEEAGGFVGEFEYPSVESLSGSVIKALAFVGSFLQSIFLSMGDFSSIITFSLTMIFVMVVVGYHRIRS